MLENVDAPGARYQRQLDQTNAFIRFHRVPAELRKKLRAYVSLQFAVTCGFEVKSIMSALPATMQVDFFTFIHGELVRQVPDRSPLTDHAPSTEQE